MDRLARRTGQTVLPNPGEDIMPRAPAASFGRAPLPATVSLPLGAPPAIAVPRGGGAIRGVDERFAVHAATGAAALAIPIPTAPGRPDFAPQLELRYDSARGNGAFGIGWSLEVPAIGRRTDRGVPRYRDGDESDTYVLAGAEDLVPALVAQDGTWTRAVDARVDTDGETYDVQRYRPRVEGAFARIERWRRRTTGAVHWRTVDRDNVTSVFGRAVDCRIADPADASHVFQWLLEESFDDRGNVVRYEYKSESADGVDRAAPQERHRLAAPDGFAQRYLKRVLHGNHTPFARDDWLFEIVLDYGEHDVDTPTPAEALPWPARADAFSTHRAGFEIRTYRLCRRVLTFHRMEELGETPSLVRSTDFDYAPDPAASRLVAVTQRGYMRNEATGGYDVQSLPPVELAYTDVVFDDTVRELAAGSDEQLPVGVDGGAYRWVDLDGEGIAGVLSPQSDAWYFKRNLGDAPSAASVGHPPPPPPPLARDAVRLAPAQVVATTPSLAGAASGGTRLMDLVGDGTLDLVLLGTEPRGFQQRADGAWRRFEPFAAAPALDWESPNLRLVDLSGDGLADVLVTEDECFTWYPSRARRGFAGPEQVHRAADEERGPVLVFADATQSVYLADMDGDGLTDLVRVRNGEVCYWPSLGHGRFGARVVMDGAPRFDHPELFDQRRVRLADVDGSGTADLIYLGRDAVSIWPNESGNRWSAPRRVTSFPPVDDLSSVEVADVAGNGTACLVWSSPLAGDASRALRYVELTGGRKPHLLSVVRNNVGGETRVEYVASTRFFLADRAAERPWVTRLPFPVHVVERVETRDAITGTTLVCRYAYHHGHFDGEEREFRGFGLVEQWDTESFAAGATGTPEVPNAPPVYTRTWYHTGAYVEGDVTARHFASEYYADDAQAARLPDTVLPPGLDGEDARQACRALRGHMLRQETYAVDDAAERVHPYTVVEASHALRLVQPRVDGIVHAVFAAHAGETLAYDYERDPADPRVAHAMTLAVDDFGNVTRSLAVAYPRRSPAFPEQARTLVTVAESDVVNHVDDPAWYRVGVPVERRSFELTGAPPPAGAVYTLDEMRSALAQATELPYEGEPTEGVVQRRLLARGRTRYYRDDLAGRLPFGTVESRALPFETYTLAFTPGLLARAYGDRVDAALLADEGRYVPDDDGTWWAPSGQPTYDAERFFLPVRTVDPFGQVTTVTYDAHALLVVRTEDPLGNVVSARPDYRTLQPSEITDANGSRAAARFDALGLVVATAVRGREGLGEGDTLDDPTTRVEYDRFAWLERGRPTSTHTFARERHGPDNPRFQERVTYADGFGRVVMTKVQAEPGLAPLRDAEGALVLDGGEPVLVDTSPEVRWVGTGRTVRDNKGNPVRQYEPYFSSTPAFEDEAELVERGVTPVLRYDPLGRVVKTDLPNGTAARAELGTWRTRTWDASDTVLESAWLAARQALPPGDPERRAAGLALAHAGTPTVAHLDVLGRPFMTEVDDGTGPRQEVRVALDVEGRPRTVTDARGNVMEVNTFSPSGARLHNRSADGGERRMLRNAAGNPIRGWDGRGQTARAVYDALQRPSHRFVRATDGGEALLARTVYGEAHPDAAPGGAGVLNLRGRVHQQYDGAGVVTNEAFDFAGNLVRSHRRLAREFRAGVDWSELAALTDVAAVEAAAAPLLEDETFTTRAAYDALGRVTSLTTPDGSETLPAYGEANLLARLDVRLRGAADATPFVTDVDHDALGRRERVRYAAGVTTDHAYERDTLRLARLRTTRAGDNGVLQDLRYTYDPVGNVVEIRDGAQQTVFFDNAEVSPDARYEYDALYRLTRADGREHAGLAAGTAPDHRDVPAMPVPHPNDGQALRAYTERYAYDEAGNLLRTTHAAAGTSWTRRYAYADDGNRLLATSLPGDADDGPFSATYDHDEHGNMTRMPHLARMDWDASDRLRTVDLGGGGTAFHVYDAAGRRVRTVVERLAATSEERIYLDGVELFRRRRNGAVELERETLHVADGTRRVALVETLTRDDGAPVATPSPLVRFQLGNHLGSACLELDDAGAVLSYEEYHPFGTTAYRAARADVEASPKRYRYAARERDEDTGLYYHGTRYYAPWLARWTAADPAGPVDGPNLYRYARNNPVALVDRNGLAPEPSEQGSPNPVREDFATDAEFLAALRQWQQETYRTVVRQSRTKPREPEDDPASPSLLERAALMFGPAGRIVEGAYWDPYFGPQTKGERFQRNSARGFRFDRAAGNNAGRTKPAIDRVTPTTVEQVKSMATERPASIRGQVRSAATKLSNWMEKNPAVAATRQAVLRVMMPTGASEASAEVARTAVLAARGRTPRPGVTVTITRGLPGIGTVLRWFGFAGGAVSTYGLVQDIQSGDVYAGIGNAAGTASFGLELGAIGAAKLGLRGVGLGTAGAVIGSFAAGWGAGRSVAEAAGEEEYWSGAQGERMSPEEHERRLEEASPFSWPDNWWIEFIP
jgi:RHS repeat-associated protein